MNKLLQIERKMQYEMKNFDIDKFEDNLGFKLKKLGGKSVSISPGCVSVRGGIGGVSNLNMLLSIKKVDILWQFSNERLDIRYIVTVPIFFNIAIAIAMIFCIEIGIISSIVPFWFKIFVIPCIVFFAILIPSVANVLRFHFVLKRFLSDYTVSGKGFSC